MNREIRRLIGGFNSHYYEIKRNDGSLQRWTQQGKKQDRQRNMINCYHIYGEINKELNE